VDRKVPSLFKANSTVRKKYGVVLGADEEGLPEYDQGLTEAADDRVSFCSGLEKKI